jgi:hypothetical protein
VAADADPRRGRDQVAAMVGELIAATPPPPGIGQVVDSLR